MNPPVPRIILRPNQSWLQIDWRGIIQYSDLLRELIMRDFTAKYKQTILGPLWSIINPLLTTMVFTLLFGRVMRVSPEGIPPLLFYLCSLLGWSYFANVLGYGQRAHRQCAHFQQGVFSAPGSADRRHDLQSGGFHHPVSLFLLRLRLL